MLNNIDEFIQICRAVVVHHSPTDLCGRLKSFMVLDKMTQLNASNAGMTHKHYREGLYWARDWYNNGACDEIKKEYDILVLRALSLEPYQEDIESNEWVYPLHLNIVADIQILPRWL